MKYNKELLNRFLNNRLMVAVRTYKEWDQFMQLLEEETDATWYGVEKPTTFNEWFTYEKDSIIICGEIEKSELSFDTAKNHPKDGIVGFKELIKGEEEMTEKQITIEELEQIIKSVTWYYFGKLRSTKMNEVSEKINLFEMIIPQEIISDIFELLDFRGIETITVKGEPR